MKKTSTFEMVTHQPEAVLQKVSRLSADGEHSDVRVFCGDELVYACYDQGRTLVVNPQSVEGEGFIDMLRRAWQAATR